MEQPGTCWTSWASWCCCSRAWWGWAPPLPSPWHGRYCPPYPPRVEVNEASDHCGPEIGHYCDFYFYCILYSTNWNQEMQEKSLSRKYKKHAGWKRHNKRKTYHWTEKFRKALEHSRQVWKQQPDKSGGVNFSPTIKSFLSFPYKSMIVWSQGVKIMELYWRFWGIKMTNTETGLT